MICILAGRSWASLSRAGHLAGLAGLFLAGLWTPSLRAQAPSRKAPLELSAATNHNLAIVRSALGKNFLMSASTIAQAGAPTSYALQGKIVRFELFHDGVDLYEAEDGLVVTKDLPARRLLATLPIVSAEADRIVVDFNRGMRRVFTDSWTSPGDTRHDQVLEVPESRVFAVEQRDDFLVIRQSVQARSREADADREARYEVRYEVRYFFSAYTPAANPGREQAPADVRYARFFTSPTMVEPVTGRATQKMARFDLSKPIQFYYSANTPKEYVEAVRDGILYWNRAFKREAIKVERAPDGVTAPDARYNIVQWVPWDNAGFAYADVLLDPRSGESRHGQAYMTSVFGVGGRARARAALRAMLELANDKAGEKKMPAGGRDGARLGVGFLESASACRINPGEFAMQYAAGLQELLANDQLGDAAVLRASQDYVREVVAHEVGHVLGLRHNFAGSLGSDLTHRELDDWFRAYLADRGTGAFSNRLSSASTMEYNDFKASAFIGWKMRTETNALPHDVAAIQWGYFDAKEASEKKLLFGTDGGSAVWGDVLTFDYGVEPVVGAYGSLSARLRNLPNSVVEEFIRARAPRDPRDRVPLEQVNLAANGAALLVANDVASMLSWFRASARSLKVENRFEFIGELNQKERAKAHWKSLAEQMEKLGGIDRALFAFLPLDLKLETKGEPMGVQPAEKVAAAALAARLEKLLDSPAYTNWVGLDDKKYVFTKDEKELIVKRGKRYFEEFEKDLVKLVCVRLENAPRDLGIEATGIAGEDDLAAKLERRIVELARLVVLAKDDDRPIKGKVDRSNVEVVEFKYDQESRLAAAKALNDKTGTFRGWATDAKGDLNKALKDDVDAALNIANLKDFKDSNLSRPLREWYLRQQDILGLLPPRPAGK